MRNRTLEINARDISSIIENLISEIEELEESNNSLRDEIIEKDSVISELEDKIEDLRNTIMEMNELNQE